MTRIKTIPNIITICRLVFLVPFIFIALDDPFVGAIIAAALGATDFLDGWIARKFHQESELGRILDPISDRALMLVSLTVFLIADVLPIWFVVVIGIRELAVTFGTLFIFSKKKVRMDVNYIGKVGAFAAMVATPAWVMSETTHGTVQTLWLWFAIFESIIAIGGGYYSLIEYVKAYSRAK